LVAAFVFWGKARPVTVLAVAPTPSAAKATGLNAREKPAEPTAAQAGVAKETADDKIERMALIAMTADAEKAYDGKHRTQITAKEASDVAKKTAVFIQDSSALINQGVSAQSDALASKSTTAFTILGMWPKAAEMSTYGACEMALRNMGRVTALRQAAAIATDAARKTKLIAAADSLIEPYQSSADACLGLVGKN
jgi:hypothetical protein